MGKCTVCNKWNSLVEEIDSYGSINKHVTKNSGKKSKAEKITEIESEKEPRITIKMKEFNRVLGGGIVPGSLVLIGGDPGIGKSTLLLQVSAQLAEKQLRSEEHTSELQSRFDLVCR